MTDKIESDYDTGWREGYEAASGAAQAIEQTRRPEVTALRADIERLQADIDMWHKHYAGLLNDCHDENKRLREEAREAVRSREHDRASGSTDDAGMPNL